MGNICRSPLAEGVFRHRANERGVVDRFVIDSAGTGGWHAGEPPDRRMLATAKRFGISLACTARQITRRDLDRFHHIICMDETNRREVLALANGADHAAKVRLLLEFDAASPAREVPDPYYGGPEGFETVFRLVDSACEKLLAHLLEGAEGG
jgi:protein-tyrosine phosphatase